MVMTEKSPSINNKQSTDWNVKNVNDFNRSIPLQGKDTPSSISISISPKARALDFSDINAQYEAKRCLEIAAAGFHHTIIIGPPGSKAIGKEKIVGNWQLAVGKRRKLEK